MVVVGVSGDFGERILPIEFDSYGEVHGCALVLRVAPESKASFGSRFEQYVETDLVILDHDGRGCGSFVEVHAADFGQDSELVHETEPGPFVREVFELEFNRWCEVPAELQRNFLYFCYYPDSCQGCLCPCYRAGVVSVWVIVVIAAVPYPRQYHFA